MKGTDVYEELREVPSTACRTIAAGRLKGKTDINPMWRIKKLTEVFGPCGIGWKYVIRDKRLETSPTGEIAAFVDIDLYTKGAEGWSEAIPGTGGSMFVAKEKNGPYTNDECYKMALTDAISVAGKALGLGADVYWSADNTKYDQPQAAPAPHDQSKAVKLKAIAKENDVPLEEVAAYIKLQFHKTKADELTAEEFEQVERYCVYGPEEG